jgi:hypothetical protein
MPLPTVLSTPSLNIVAINMGVAASHTGKEYDSQVFSWTEKDAWKGSGGSRTACVLPLEALGETFKRQNRKIDEALLQLKTMVTYKPMRVRQPIILNHISQIPIYTGEKNVASPMAMFNNWVFDANYLTFIDPDYDSDGLMMVEMSIDAYVNKVKILSVPRVRMNPNDRRDPDPSNLSLNLLIPKAADKVLANITFTKGEVKDNGRVKPMRGKIKWAHNGKNLLELDDYQGNFVGLEDWDWEEE